MKVKSLSRVQLLVTSWTAAYQAPPSMEFARHEYWSGVPLPSPNISACFIYIFLLKLRGWDGNYFFSLMGEILF